MKEVWNLPFHCRNYNRGMALQYCSLSPLKAFQKNRMGRGASAYNRREIGAGFEPAPTLFREDCREKKCVTSTKKDLIPVANIKIARGAV
ncbi:MAG: hypothetical protein ABIL06_22585, partial [Pseudomonadota bacterium]